MGIRTLFALALFFAAPAMAAQQCYSSAEVEAEQLLRLHSELMVITVTCHTGSRGENLVPAYTTFTQEHLAALHNADKRSSPITSTPMAGRGSTASILCARVWAMNMARKSPSYPRRCFVSFSATKCCKCVVSGRMKYAMRSTGFPPSLKLCQNVHATCEKALMGDDCAHDS